MNEAIVFAMASLPVTGASGALAVMPSGNSFVHDVTPL
jgi:hypothetical protein